MAEYDIISKHLIRAYSKDIVRFVLGRADVEVDGILETELPTVETRRIDSLLRVRIDGEEALVHIEFQTTDSTGKPMPIRMASYIIRLIELYGLPVYSFVIYLRPSAGRRDEGYYTQELPGHRVFVEYKVFRLSEIEGQGIIEDDHPGLLPFAPLMKPPVGMASEDWLRQCIRKSDAVSLKQATKVDFLGSLAVLSGLAYEPTIINRIFSQEGLMDAIMRESSFAQYIKEQGIEQGIQESIREALEIRFDASAAGQFAGRIAVIDDLQRLKQLLRAAVQVDDLEAFQRVLDADA